MNDFSTLNLHGERLLLRPLEGEDAPALMEIFSDPRVMHYWSTPPWTTLDQARALISDDLGALSCGKHLRLGVVLKSRGELVGTCSLFNLSPGCRRAEIGYALAHAHWGRGYLQEALTALLAHAFGPLGLNRIEADIDPRNLASARSLERLGFSREGLLRERWVVGEEVSDSALYGLLQRDWAARKPGAVPAAVSLPMLSHVFQGVGNFERELAFYRPLMACLGFTPRFCDRSRPWAAWHSEGGARPLFVIGVPHDGAPHAPGNGQMLALTATSRRQVDEAHALALVHGGLSEGEPGLRPAYHAHYYGAYFRDPAGNKLCVVCHAPPAGDADA